LKTFSQIDVCGVREMYHTVVCEHAIQFLNILSQVAYKTVTMSVLEVPMEDILSNAFAFIEIRQSDYYMHRVMIFDTVASIWCDLLYSQEDHDVACHSFTIIAELVNFCHCQARLLNFASDSRVPSKRVSYGTYWSLDITEYSFSCSRWRG